MTRRNNKPLRQMRPRDPQVRARFAEACTQPELLEELAADPERTVRGAVAANPHTPEEVLSRLAGDGDVSVREGVGANPAATLEILERLAADDHLVVRQRIAGREDTPPHLLDRLASDPDYYIRQTVISNPRARPGTKVVAHLCDVLQRQQHLPANSWDLERLRREVSLLTPEQLMDAEHLARGWRGNLDEFFAVTRDG